MRIAKKRCASFFKNVANVIKIDVLQKKGIAKHLFVFVFVE